MHPTYMPMQWLPYSLPKLTQTDMRTFAMLMLNGSIFFILLQYIKHKQSLFQIDTFLLILLLIFIPFIIIERDLMVITVEEGIAGYYLLIPVLIVLRKYHWASFMICICLLSRYSIIFWVPLYLFVIFIDQPKLALQQLIIICIGFFMMYILPFLMKDPSIFLAGYHHHISATLGEWERMNEQNIPYHLFDGQGFAFLFYQLRNVSALNKLLLLQRVQLAISIGFISLAGVYYYKIRRSVSKELFLISSLAIYMVLFYSFIQLPYKYLFIVPCGLLVSTLLSLQLLKSLETK